MKSQIQTADEELIERFESGTISGNAFHHSDHVRLAFAYLQGYPLVEALARFSAALKQFASAQGKAERYNETITMAYFFLINERMAENATSSWEEFARDNPDLLVWKDGILNRYYRESTLASDLARRVFMLPDKCA
ncbi:MAG TPA: hypothetical protein VFA85_11470 [Terriglobales bacterium]|nr:hypothetical protein [Terriglobales bacterium]